MSEDEFKAWLTGKNMSFYYPLATPTDTEITNAALIAQLDAVNNGALFFGTSNVTMQYASGNAQATLDFDYWTWYKGAQGEGVTVDSSLSDISTNPVQNRIVKSALDGKQDTLGAGDISTSLIADGAITQAKLASSLEVGEVVYEYIQESTSSTDVPLTVTLDYTTYKRYEVFVEYASASSITEGPDRVWLYSGETAASGGRCGIYLWGSTVIQADMGTVTNGESTVVHRSSLPNSVQHYMQIDKITAGSDSGVAWRSKSQSPTGFCELSGIYDGVDTIKYTLAKPAAGGVFRVIGYR
jgi:hypothetical protein